MRISFGLVLSFGALLALPLAGACSSSGGGFNDDDAGAAHDGGGTGDEGGNPLPPDGGDPYCGAQADFQSRCSAQTGCDRSRLAVCSQVGAALSDVARAAATACGVQGDCAKPFSSVLSSSCVTDKLSTGTPTAAQTKVATDYCAACDATNTGCAAAFFTGGAAAVGYQVLLSSDDVARQIDTRCAVASDAGTAACKSAFTACAGLEFSAAVPDPAACNGDG